MAISILKFLKRDKTPESEPVEETNVAAPVQPPRAAAKTAVSRPVSAELPAPEPLDLEKIRRELMEIARLVGTDDPDPAPQAEPDDRMAMVDIRLGDVAKLAPEALASADLTGSSAETLVSVAIPDLYEQLGRGKVETKLSLLLSDIPPSHRTEYAQTHASELVSIPLPLVVAAVQPGDLRKRTPAKERDFGASFLPNLFNRVDAVPAPAPTLPPPPVVQPTVLAAELPQASAPAVSEPPPSVAPALEPALASAQAPAAVEPEPPAVEPLVVESVVVEPVAPVEAPSSEVSAEAAAIMGFAPVEEPVAAEPAAAESAPAAPAPAEAMPSAAGPEVEIAEPAADAWAAVHALVESSAPAAAVPAPVEEPAPVAEVPAAASAEAGAAANMDVSSPPAPEPAEAERWTRDEVEPEQETTPITAVHGVEEESLPSFLTSTPRVMRNGLDLNRATAVEMVARLDGVGARLAGQIVRHREERGPFRDLYDLACVRGVRSGIFERMSGLPWPRELVRWRSLVDEIVGGDGRSLPDVRQVAERFARQPGYEGCLIVHEDGLPLAASREDAAADTLGAFAPQMFKKIEKYARRLKAGRVKSITLCLDDQSITLVQNGPVIFVGLHERNKLARKQVEIAEAVAMELGRRLSPSPAAA